MAHDRMSVASLCNHDLSVVVVGVISVVIVVVCEHSSWPHAWPNKVHTLHAHAAISISDLYSLILSYISFWLIAINLHFSDILNFIYQWLGNCWYWRGDYLGRLKTTLQYSKFHLSLTGQLLMVKVSMPMFSYTYLYIHVYTNINE